MLYVMLKDLIFKSYLCINKISRRERMNMVYIWAGFAFDFYLLKNTVETLRTDT